MKRLLIGLLTGMLAVVPVSAYDQAEVSENFEVIGSDFSIKFDHYDIVESREGNPCIAVYFVYQNDGSEPKDTTSQFYVDAFQNGMQIDKATYEFTGEPMWDYISNSIKSLKDGASIEFVNVFGLQDTSNPVEFYITEFENYGKLGPATIDISQYDGATVSTDDEQDPEDRIAELEKENEELRKRIEELEAQLNQ